jgi:LacI family transcriptional regulator
MMSDATPLRTSPPEQKQRRARKPFQGTIKLADVAKHAGVSTATASRAINTPRLVSTEARERVETAIRELNWIPHGAAKALASLRTRTIGLIVPTFGHQTIAAMIEALQHRLALADYTLLLGWPDPTLETTLKQAFNMIERGVECLILMGEDQPEALMELLERRRIFYVIAYTSGREGRKNCIGFDNFLEMSRLVTHLLSLGHHDFGLITRGYAHNDRIRQRIEAVHHTLSEAGIAVRPQHFVEVSHWLIGSGREGMQTILSRPPVPTAIVCANDYLATGALIEARAEGLTVPRDVSIVGFDDVELAGQLDPPLTTIRVPAKRIGESIAGFVLDYLEHGEATLPGRIEAELVIRGTTAPPPREPVDVRPRAEPGR